MAMQKQRHLKRQSGHTMHFTPDTLSNPALNPAPRTTFIDRAPAVHYPLPLVTHVYGAPTLENHKMLARGAVPVKYKFSHRKAKAIATAKVETAMMILELGEFRPLVNADFLKWED
jgi:hypothetical protein